MRKKQLIITGMHCTSCSNLIEKEVQKLPGIQNISVNVATEKATVTFDENKTNLEEISNTIKHAGYQADEMEKR